MPDFTVRYWFDDGGGDGRAPSYVSAGLRAESLDEATRTVQDQMGLPVFALDSDGYGRVVIVSANVRFCSILPAQTAAEAAVQAQASAAAQAASDFAARAEAAGVVDNDVRRF
jgi:hypothetical protein